MIEVLGLITARGGSRSIPRKNLAPLGGKPLIAWTIEAAGLSRRLRRTIVSTDDEEIAQVARDLGAEAPFTRPSELASDASDHISVVEHALRWLEREEFKPDYVMLLQPTSPLRTEGDIDRAIEIAEMHEAIAVVGVCEAQSHPYLTKRLDEDGTLVDFMTCDLAYPRRQDLVPAYVINGAIYLNRTDSLLRDRMFCPKGARAYVMPKERSLDIDTLWELHLAELLVRDKNALPLR